MGLFDRFTGGAAQSAAAQQQAAMQQVAALQQQVGQAYGAAAAAVNDPETAAFMQLPMEEQLRQQQELQAYGRNLQHLTETGRDVEITIRSLQPTGTTLGGQREYQVEVEIAAPGQQPYPAALRQVIPAATFSQYAVGGRYKGKVAQENPANATVLERIA